MTEKFLKKSNCKYILFVASKPKRGRPPKRHAEPDLVDMDTCNDENGGEGTSGLSVSEGNRNEDEQHDFPAVSAMEDEKKEPSGRESDKEDNNGTYSIF